MSKVCRVAFTGASGTGKSTLAEWLGTTYALPLNPVGSRSVARSMGFASPYDVDTAGRRTEFQTLLLREKMAWESRAAFVTDRTTFDNLTYSLLHDAQGIDESMFESACSGMRRYEYVVFCPVSVFINVANDPERLDNAVYHQLYDAALWGLLQRFKPPETRLVTVPFMDLEHRKDFLRSLMRPPGS